MSTATAPRRRQRRTVGFCQVPGSKKMDIGSATDVGRVRETNEDSLLTIELSGPRRGQVVVCVADGMGGHNAGEVASALAVESVRRSVESAEAANAADDLLVSAVTLGNATIWEAAAQDAAHDGMRSEEHTS